MIAHWFGCLSCLALLAVGCGDSGGGDPSVGVCVTEGTACTKDTAPSADGLLGCGPANSLVPDALTCEVRCDVDADCVLATTRCLDVALTSEAVRICSTANCTSIFASETECVDAGPTGGTCLYDADDTAGLCYANGTRAPGETCAPDDRCVAQHICSAGTCVALCSVASEAWPCDAGEVCLGGVERGICRTSCAGLDALPGVCGPGQGCRPTSADTGICEDVGVLAEGAACDGAPCGEGLACVSQGRSGNHCVPRCDRTSEAFGDGGCADGDICLADGPFPEIGVCYSGCVPFGDGSECPPDQALCIPFETAERGACFDSGAVPIGDPCQRSVAGFLAGNCVPNALCSPEGGSDTVGTCRSLCVPFGDNTATCGANEVCGIWGALWGACADVADPRNGLLAPCDVRGTWCNENAICLEVDQQGNNLCLGLCRIAEGDADCEGGTVCNSDLLSSETVGLCVPN